MSKEEKSNLILQGSILAAAGLITKIIGFLYRIPMANALGSEGNGIYAAAFSIYNVALTLSSYSLPLAVSKLVSARIALKDYKNSYRVFINALIFALIAGGIAGTILLVGADFIGNLLSGIPGVSKPIKILAPTTLIVAILGVFRGYFQGTKNMVPTAFSQIIEQLINAVVSVVLVRRFMDVYKESSDVAAYGAAGGTLGTLMGALTGLVFFVILYFVKRPKIKALNHLDNGKTESNKHIYRVLFLTIIPVVFSQTIYQIGNALDISLFQHIMNAKGVHNATELQGVFSTQYNQLINLPVAVAAAMAASVIPGLAIAGILEDYNKLHEKIDEVIKINMAIAFPAAVGLAVLSRPIMQLLYPRLVTYQDLSVHLMIAGSSAIVFYALSTITTAVLQGCGYMRIPVIHSLISLVLHIGLVGCLLYWTDLGVYALVIGNIALPLVVCILNVRFLMIHLRYQYKVSAVFGKPIFASVVMGFIAYLCFVVFDWILNDNRISFAISFIIAVMVYLFLLIRIRYFTRLEVVNLPFGKKLAGFMKEEND